MAKMAKKSKKTKYQGSDFCYFEGTTLILNVLGTPGAKRTEIGKPKGNQLCISVTTPPIRGRATDHMVKFLAEQFNVKTAQIEVVFGRMNINKQLKIHKPNQLPSVISRYLNQKKSTHI